MHGLPGPRYSVTPAALRQLGLRCAGSLAAVLVATAALAPVHEQLGLINVVLVFLLLVVLIAARWGWAPGLVASIAANVAYNFFFVPPLHTFRVQEPHNVVALLVFLGVASLTSALLARARAGEAAALRREQETAILYELSRLIIVGADAHSTLTTICRRVCDSFDVDSCAVLLPGEQGLQPQAWSGPIDTAPITAFERRAAATAFTSGRLVFLNDTPARRRPRLVGKPGPRDRRLPVIYVPLRVGDQTVGVLQVIGALSARVAVADAVRLVEAFADEAALTVDRDRLLHEAAGARALQETDRLKSALLSAVSHDLRTPLGSIKASVSSLIDDDVTWDDAVRREFLTAIDEETDRLTRLVSNLLDLSRIEGGALHPEKDWYDVRELLETVAGRLSRTVPRHHLVLAVASDAGVAPLDYVQIGQVVTNLVENAAKFAPDGTTIRVGARRLHGETEISVTDQGPGIPPEQRTLVFEKFQRLTRAGRRASGAGLGLAISKGFVEAHGGRMWVEDAPGGGSRFVVRLPAPPPPPSTLTPTLAEAR